jgi:chorismate mutase
MAKETKKEYTDQEASELMTEIKTGRRVFETEKGLVQIRFPKVDENRLADWEYSKVFNQAIKDGIPTNKQMAKQIEELELWTKEDDAKVEKLREEIDKQIVVMSKMAEGSKNMEKAQEKIAELRNQLIAIQQERQKYFQQTAESKADEAKMSFLIYKCTEDANTGKPFWSSYEDFKNEENQGVVNTIAYQFITFINGLPADFLQQAPAVTDEETDGEVV